LDGLLDGFGMTEDKPHVVFAVDQGDPEMIPAAYLCKSYKQAHRIWLKRNTYKDPWLIATLGRVIDPSAPIIDVNE
jgi:hypothetical protein